MCRISSPGEYSLCSANSTDWPWCGDLWRPERIPSVTARTRSFSVPSLARTAGSRRGRLGSAIVRSALHLLEEPPDDLRARDALALGPEVRDHAVHEDVPRERADVLDARRHAAVEDGAALGAEDEVLARARASAPGDVLLHEVG